MLKSRRSVAYTFVCVYFPTSNYNQDGSSIFASMTKMRNAKDTYTHGEANTRTIYLYVTHSCDTYVQVLIS